MNFIKINKNIIVLRIKRPRIPVIISRLSLKYGKKLIISKAIEKVIITT